MLVENFRHVVHQLRSSEGFEPISDVWGWVDGSMKGGDIGYSLMRIKDPFEKERVVDVLSKSLAPHLTGWRLRWGEFDIGQAATAAFSEAWSSLGPDYEKNNPGLNFRVDTPYFTEGFQMVPKSAGVRVPLAPKKRAFNA